MPMKRYVHVVVQHLIVCTMIFYRVIAQLSDWMLCNAPI